MHHLSKVDEHVVSLLVAELTGKIARQQDALGMSSAELAERIGVNRATVQRVRGENAAPTLANVVAMALAVGLTPVLRQSGEDVVKPHEAALVHRGLYHNRTSRKDGGRDTHREKALAHVWEAWNTYADVGPSPVMQSLIPGYEQSEASAAATLVQWLGTNVGFDFLQQALNAAGYDIVERPAKRTSRSKQSR